MQAQTARPGLADIAARALLPFLPAAMSLAFIWVSFGRSILDFMPHYDVDQFIYWREMATFASAGFNGGYYGVNEMLSPLKGFGPHGAGVVIVYGSLYSLMPELGFAAMPVINVSLLTLALAAYVWGLHPSLGEAVGGCLAVALYPPLFLYLPTSFQEGFHYAAAVGLAMVFIRLMKRQGEQGQTGFQLFAGVFLLLLCLVRYTWAVCFIPYFYLCLEGRRLRLPLAVGCAVAVSLLVVLVFNLFVPAWYGSPEAGVHVSGASLSERIAFAASRAMGNIGSLFDFRNNQSVTAILLGLLLFTSMGVVLALRHAALKRDGAPVGVPLLLLIAVNIPGLMVVFIAAWTGSGGHLVRLLSANYLFCFIVSLHFLPRRWLYLATLYNALLLPQYMGIFQVYHLPGYLNGDARRIVETFMSQTAPHLIPPKGRTPWDRTVFIRIPGLPLAQLGLPPEYGIQTASGSAKATPRLSRYALFNVKPPESDGNCWRLVTSTILGELYIRHSGADAPVPSEGTTP